MALSINRVVLMGFLGNAPIEHKANGHTVCTMSLAVKERYKTRQGEITDITDWIEVVCFGQCAKYALSYLQKGDLISVEGKIKTSTYTDKNTGETRKTVQVHCAANALNLIKRKEDNPIQHQNTEYKSQTQQQYNQNYQDNGFNNGYQNQFNNGYAQNTNYVSRGNFQNNSRAVR